MHARTILSEIGVLIHLIPDSGKLFISFFNNFELKLTIYFCKKTELQTYEDYISYLKIRKN